MEVKNELFKGVPGRRLQKRLACTMREKVREARWRLRMNRLNGYPVGDCNSDMDAL